MDVIGVASHTAVSQHGEMAGLNCQKDGACL